MFITLIISCSTLSFIILIMHVFTVTTDQNSLHLLNEDWSLIQNGSSLIFAATLQKKNNIFIVQCLKSQDHFQESWHITRKDIHLCFIINTKYSKLKLLSCHSNESGTYHSLQLMLGRFLEKISEEDSQG